MHISKTKLTKHLLLFVSIFISSCSSGEDPESPIPETPSNATCDGTISLALQGIGSDYINLSWTTDGDFSTFDIEYGAKGFALGQGTRLQATTTSIELQSLEPNSEYDVYVRGLCSESNGQWTTASTYLTYKDENIFEGNVSLNNQDEVDAFGANGYTKINGNLIISGFWNPVEPYIVDLSSLETISEITGALSIEANTKLELLDGLDNVEYVGQLWLTLNPELASIEALSSLKEITGYYDMENVEYPALLRVQSCSKLTNLEPLHNIPEVDYLILESNNELTNINGLRGITNVTKDVNIRSNLKLKSLNGLNQLTTVGENFYLSNPELISLEGLENLGTVGKTMELLGNNKLISIAEIDNLEYVDELIIVSVENLESLEGINLNAIQNRLALASIGGFTDFTGISGDITSASIEITNCYNLSYLTGLESLESAGQIYLSGNSELKNLVGLQGLTTIDNQLHIEGNNQITSLNGLENLASVNDIELINNYSLDNIAALAGLNNVVSNIDISDNYNLSSLEGLENIADVNRIIIYRNNVLENLSGMEGVRSVQDRVLINYNNSLSDFCALGDLFSIGGFSGEWFVNGNILNPTIEDMQNGICN
ncbi:fibronectin type III domain-containing protein [Flagellimonas zhangzhouensis]|uniref:Fibronectin type III domain-containing protein n=1 Tax=Flagellimonas zhangzhouensis TaxID=1073328 RepID=A0A1H2S6W5_9FLAO|nr:fibronectin type III domain-containing protein [Allomuricauda zhangzhouensis]SDQ71491.1 Fibronectin type III domain-containing protein [Allomuricauda zhangzhouensis]SDW27422.1 Fibronectin type III domain-containing protein [Allomuricauda zhangzhouensis]